MLYCKSIRCATISRPSSIIRHGKASQVCRAEGNGNAPPPPQSPKGPADQFKSQFSWFTKQMRSQVDNNPRDAKYLGTMQPLTQQQNQIRKEESFLVDLWSSENFPKFGGLLTVIILFLVILSGPP